MCRECVSVCVCLRERERQCVCVCVCERERERERESTASLPLCFSLSLCPPSLHFSSPLSGFSPFPPLHFPSIISLPPLPPPPPPPPLPFSPSLSPPLSFSSSASLLAVDVTEAEAEATLPLIGCHSQVSDKEKGEKKKGDEGAKGRGEKSGRVGWMEGVREKTVSSHPSEHQLTVEWRNRGG